MFTRQPVVAPWRIFMNSKNKQDREVRTIGEVRYLNPDLPMVKADGVISLENVEGEFRIETIGTVVASVLSRADPGMTPMEAVCTTFICQQLYAGKDLMLTPDVADAIIKSFSKKLEQGVLSPIAHGIVTWIVRPEDESLARYRAAFEELYDGLEAKRKAAKITIAKLNEQAAAARASLHPVESALPAN